MNYVDYLKRYESFDKYILFLHELNIEPAEIARMVKMTRQHVYNVIERNKEMIEHLSTLEQKDK